MLAGYK